MTPRNVLSQGDERSIDQKLKTLMKDTAKPRNIWKDIPCSWTGRILNVHTISKQPTDSMQSLPMAFFTKLGEIILKFI